MIKGANLNLSTEHLNVQAEELKARIIENEKLQSQVHTYIHTNTSTIDHLLYRKMILFTAAYVYKDTHDNYTINYYLWQ